MKVFGSTAKAHSETFLHQSTAPGWWHLHPGWFHVFRTLKCFVPIEFTLFLGEMCRSQGLQLTVPAKEATAEEQPALSSSWDFILGKLQGQTQQQMGLGSQELGHHHGLSTHPTGSCCPISSTGVIFKMICPLSPLSPAGTGGRGAPDPLCAGCAPIPKTPAAERLLRLFFNIIIIIFSLTSFHAFHSKIKATAAPFRSREQKSCKIRRLHLKSCCLCCSGVRGALASLLKSSCKIPLFFTQTHKTTAVGPLLKE